MILWKSKPQGAVKMSKCWRLLAFSCSWLWVHVPSLNASSGNDMTAMSTTSSIPNPPAACMRSSTSFPTGAPCMIASSSARAPYTSKRKASHHCLNQDTWILKRRPWIVSKGELGYNGDKAYQSQLVCCVTDFCLLWLCIKGFVKCFYLQHTAISWKSKKMYDQLKVLNETHGKLSFASSHSINLFPSLQFLTLLK